jgi:hypothetical protein
MHWLRQLVVACLSGDNINLHIELMTEKLGPDFVVQNPSFQMSWCEPACSISFWSAFSLTQKKVKKKKLGKTI